MEERINVIGGGFAGSEAALTLSSFGLPVKIIEKRPDPSMSHFNNSSGFAYPVCSNSFKSVEIKNAHGLLKGELSVMRSSVLKEAIKAKVKAGKALAVDRDIFSASVRKNAENRKNIELAKRDAGREDIGENTIIATGPFSSDAILNYIKKKTGKEFFHFIDSVSPIISRESINFNKCFIASRYNEGTDYVNCPMTRDEFDVFYDALINAEKVLFDDTDKEQFFSACMPVEEVALYGKRALVFGIMKPIGFDKKYFAVVQLRNENKNGTMLNIVGFQTRLKWGEQKRVISMIPGLENAKIMRYGVMHRNPYIDSPFCLGENLELKSENGIFIAGQITGSEGYMEAVLTGLYAGLSVYCKIKHKEITLPPETTMSGSLLRYILRSEKPISPMNANFGLLKVYNKKDKIFFAKKALRDIYKWYNETTH